MAGRPPQRTHFATLPLAILSAVLALCVLQLAFAREVAAQTTTPTVDCSAFVGQGSPRSSTNRIDIVPFVGWSIERQPGPGSTSRHIDLYLNPRSSSGGTYVGTVAVDRSRPRAEVALDLGTRHGSWTLDWTVDRAARAAKALVVSARSRCGSDSATWIVNRTTAGQVLTVDVSRPTSPPRTVHAIVEINRTPAPLGLAAPSPRTVRLPKGTSGYTISFPQCNDPFPAQPFAQGIIGVNGGRPYTQNSCLARQFAWARLGAAAPALYLNTASPSGATIARGNSGPAGDCDPADSRCISYNYGYNGAEDAFAYALSQGATASMWWVDVELENTWSADTVANARVIRGAIDYLRTRSVAVGIYSTAIQWRDIAGNYRPGVPTWVAGPTSFAEAARCPAEDSFGGGPLWLIEYPVREFGGFYIC